MVMIDMHDWKFAILKKNNMCLLVLVVAASFWRLHLHPLSSGVGLLVFASLSLSHLH